MEKRAKTLSGENYVPLPDSHEFVKSLVEDLGLKQPEHEVRHSTVRTLPNYFYNSKI